MENTKCRCVEKSKKLSKYYEMKAKHYNCDFLNDGKFIVCSDIDGARFDLKKHKKLGIAVAKKVKEIL